MDSEDKIEYAPKGMFPEDDAEDTYDISGDLDVWNRTGSGYTWGSGTSWWSTSGTGAVSSMWGSSSIYGSSIGRTSDSIRLAKHKRHIDSLCKVVDPTVKHTLSFGTHSTGATNMETGHIVIDGSLLRGSDTNLDVVCGLAIHEKLHVIHSKPLYQWQKQYFRDHPKMTYGERELFHSIENIIEDEYIESQLHKTCAGFVTYIEAVKEHYFNDKAKALEYTGDEFADVVNTLLMLVRYPSMLDTERRKRHAPHIRIFLTQLKTGIDSRDNTYECINSIYLYLKNVFDELYEDKSDDEKDKAMKEATSKMEDMKEQFEGDGIKMPKGMEDKLLESLLAEAMKEAKRSASTDRDEEMHRAMHKVAKELSDYKEMMDEISSRLSKEIKDVLDSDYEEMTIAKDLAPNTVHTKITWQKAIPKPEHTKRYREEASEMKPQTNKLKRKIDLYGESRKLTIRNQKRGKIDKRNLHRIPMGRMDLFKADLLKEDKPLDVCLLVDESGSMGHYTMSKARMAAISLKEALSDNPMLNLWVFGHTADEDTRGTTNMTEYWSPTMKDRPMAMGAMRAKYENRDGSAIIASADRVKKQATNAGTNKLMIILSDGAPSAAGYRGYTSTRHTASCVKHCEARGWHVIQVGFAGSTESIMKECFTNWIYVDDTDKLGDKVSKIIRKVIKV